MVDDTITTGAAFLEAIGVLEEAGIGIAQAIAVVDRSGGEVARRLADRGVRFSALVLPADLGVEDA